MREAILSLQIKVKTEEGGVASVKKEEGKPTSNTNSSHSLSSSSSSFTPTSSKSASTIKASAAKQQQKQESSKQTESDEEEERVREKDKRPDARIEDEEDEDESEITSMVMFFERFTKLYPQSSSPNLYTRRYSLLNHAGRVAQWVSIGCRLSFPVKLYSRAINRWFRYQQQKLGMTIINNSNNKEIRPVSDVEVVVPHMSYSKQDTRITAVDATDDDLPPNSYTLSTLPQLLRYKPSPGETRDIKQEQLLSAAEQIKYYITQSVRAHKLYSGDSVTGGAAAAASSSSSSSSSSNDGTNNNNNNSSRGDALASHPGGQGPLHNNNNKRAA